jgi:hypothetical protein
MSVEPLYALASLRHIQLLGYCDLTLVQAQQLNCLTWLDRIDVSCGSEQPILEALLGNPTTLQWQHWYMVADYMQPNWLIVHVFPDWLITRLAQMPRLTILDCTTNDKKVNLDCLATLPHLTSISIHNEQHSLPVLTVPLPTVTSFAITRVDSGLPPSTLLLHMPNLTELTIDHYRSSLIWLHDVAPSLCTLTLRGSFFRDLDSLPVLPSLTTLRVSLAATEPRLLPSTIKRCMPHPHHPLFPRLHTFDYDPEADLIIDLTDC